MSGNDERIQNKDINVCPICGHLVSGWSLRDNQMQLIGVLNCYGNGRISINSGYNVNLLNDLKRVACYKCHHIIEDESFILRIKNVIRAYKEKR
jgi:RNA polymerase subunit RPABC4/transcription elongation factor Spt4